MQREQLRKRLAKTKELMQINNYDLALDIHISENVIYKFLNYEGNINDKSAMKIEAWLQENEKNIVSNNTAFTRTLNTIYNEANWYNKTYGSNIFIDKIIKMCKNAGV